MKLQAKEYCLTGRRKSLNMLDSDSEMAPTRIAENAFFRRQRASKDGRLSATSVIALRYAGFAWLVRVRPP
jgi:hypothetical protein